MKGLNGEGDERGKGGIANTKSHLRGHMETYYSKGFLKYVHTWKKSKWTHQTTGETKSQPDIACHQVKLLALEISLHIIELLTKGVLWKFPNKRWPRLFVALYKLMVRPFCWKQYLHIPLNTETLYCWLSRAFPGTGSYAACYQKRKVNTSPATNISIYNGDLTSAIRR